MKYNTYHITIILLFFLAMSFDQLNAQDNYHERNHPAYYTWLRAQTQSQNYSENPTFPGHGKMSNKQVVDYLQFQRSHYLDDEHSSIDQYNMRKTIATFPEYYNLGVAAWSNQKPLLNTFYKDKIDFIRLHKQDGFLSINPIVMLGGSHHVDETNQLSNTHFQDLALGLQIRGNYKGKVDVNLKFKYEHSYAKDYEIDYYNTWNALPGYTPEQISLNNRHFQSFQPRLGIQVPIIKNHITTSFGYDSHGYGSGIRSLFLSDASAPYLYAKISTKVWKLQYDNLFAKVNTDKIPGLPQLGGHKYFSAHTLSVEIFPWWQLGLFETVTFSRKSGYEAAYLNPLIFYRSMERTLGSPDKVALGIQSDFFPVKNLKLYGQFLLNEFTSEFFFKDTGYWANKWGGQMGFLYTNVAGINNFDIQGEANLIRPYTYTHSLRREAINISNFGNGNTPLAHQLGAGFREAILKAQYQVLPTLNIQYSGHFYQQGEDKDGLNYGNNLFKSYRDKPVIFGVNMIHGPKKEVWSHHLQASYEIWPQLHFDIGGYYRTQERALDLSNNENWGIYTRLRLNFWNSALSLF